MNNPKCSAYTLRKARKIHKCCECGNEIKPGDKYHYVSGVWEEPDSFKQCYLDGFLFIAATKIHDDNRYFPEWRPSYGDLKEWLKTFREDYGKTGTETLKVAAAKLMGVTSGK